MKRTALFSDCGSYRYILRREWDRTLPKVMFIGLNPSVADAHVDDPTNRRCINFARDWGFGGMVMTNLFAYIETDRTAFLKLPAESSIGPNNNLHLLRLARSHELVIAAWGADGNLAGRADYARERITGLQCLGLTRGGEPRHPLYLRKETTPRFLQPK